MLIMNEQGIQDRKTTEKGEKKKETKYERTRAPVQV